ncbi:MAG: cytochrome c peroxidase [Woeseiaceae bacterium]|nr:cytochrome c peroxidase [Woeseiaceae bacterium]
MKRFAPLAFAVLALGAAPGAAADWSAAERDLLASLRIGTLGTPPPSPGNAVADDRGAAALGHALFFDTRLSGNGGVACATCHQPARRFTDGLPKAAGMGLAGRNAPSVIGAAYSPWLYWDGRRDSLWSQALTPLEDVNEHGTTRADVVALVATDPEYREAYTAVFGSAPDTSGEAGVDRAFANVGKALAAYERLLVPGPARFDRYVDAVLAGDDGKARDILTPDEIAGLELFIGEAQCTQCHNGPLFTNNEFHNTGTISFPGDVPDQGRIAGIPEVEADPFNCRGEFSDAGPGGCAELEFILSGPHLLGAFRTPSLRNLGGTAPYMHKGQLATLADVLAHYNEAPPAMIGHSDIEPLGLNRRELRQLEAFLLTLDAPPAAEPRWLAPPARD